MRAMVLTTPAAGRLEPLDLSRPQPGPGEVLLRVSACGVCRTDLHVVDGDLENPKIPIVPGHEIVGQVVTAGPSVRDLVPGMRVGVPWLGRSCGTCPYCQRDQENLCPDARYTGYQLDGGYAEFVVADARFAFPLPAGYDDVSAAPLLCAGVIGYRAYRMALSGSVPVRNLGLYGFGAAAHILCQFAVHEGRQVHAFTREGDIAAQEFARGLGAAWAGASSASPPCPLDAAILFAPVGELVPAALHQVVPGGVVVCAGIHMSPIPSFPYELLWEERVLRSVANLTRRDAREFLEVAAEIPLTTHVVEYPLERANEALDDLRHGRFSGAAVLRPSPAS